MRRNSWGLIAAVCVFPCLASASLGKILPLIGEIAAALAISPVAASWLISVIPLVAVLLAPFAGAVGDRLGDRRVMGIGIVVLIAGNGVDLITAGYAALMAGRAIEGVGFIFLMTGTVAMMMRVADGPRQGAAMALFGAAVPGGVGIAEALAGLTADGHWRWVFIGHGMVLLAGLALLRVLPAWQPGQASGHGAHGGHGSAWVAYRQPGPLRLCLSLLVLTLSQFGVSAMFPTYLHARFGMGTAVAALLGALGLVAGVVGNLLVCALLARDVPARPLAWGGLSVFAVFAALTFAALRSPAPMIAASVLFLMAGGFTNGLLLAVLPRVARDPAMRGRVSAMSNQLNTTGLLLGPPIAFAAFGAGGGTAVLGVVLVSALAALLLAPLSAARLRVDAAQAH